MDNIIEYIIAFFFIVSILSGLFGDKAKKKKEKEARSRANQGLDDRIYEQEDYRIQSEDDRLINTGARESAPVSYKAPQKFNKDILEEMFGVKIPKTDDWNSYKDPNQYNDQSTWDPESEFKVSTKIEEQKKKIADYDLRPSLESYTNAKSKYSNASRTDIFRNAGNNIASKVEHFSTAKNDKVMAIRAKLDNNISLKDMIVITEILNKPKALRRR